METSKEQKIPRDASFKSYYVVWKPSLDGRSKWRTIRLNRTM